MKSPQIGFAASENVSHNSPTDFAFPEKDDEVVRQPLKKLIFLTFFLLSALPLFGQKCRDQEALKFVDQVRVTYPTPYQPTRL